MAACGTIESISSPGMKAYELVLATSGKRMAVAWHGGVDERDAIYLQSLDEMARPDGPPVRITNGQSYAYEPDLQLIENDVVLAWYEKEPDTGDLTAWLARVDRTGRIIWRRALSADGGQARNPVLRLSGGALLVAWIETRPDHEAVPAIWTARFSADGNPLDEARKAGQASADTWNLNAAVDRKGVFYVVYDARLGTQANELHMLAISRNSVSHVQLSADDGSASVYPDLGFNEEGQAALTWFDDRDDNEEVYVSVLPLRDLISGETPEGVRVTHTPAKSIGAYLAWNGERMALVWCDAQEGQQELYGQMLDVHGKPLTAIRRLTTSPTQSSIPSIRPWRTGFLVAWNEYEGVGEGVHRQITLSEARLLHMD